MPVIAASGLSLDPIAKPVAAVLAAIYSVVPNYGVAIMVLSLAWMILIAPLTLKTTRSMLAMQKLQPQIKKLQEQHRNDRAALSQAQMDLFKENNVSPFSSCLPTVLPLPVFFALFRVISGLSRASGPKYLSQSTRMYADIKASHGHLNAFGIDLSKNLFSSHSGVASALPYAFLILIMMGTQYLQTVQMMSRNPANADNPQAKMMKYLPIVFGIFFLRFPAGVILYYATSNVCRIGQQTLMYRFDPKVKTLAAKDIEEIEAETRDIESGKRKREPMQAPAPKSRIRDMLASAAEQSAKAREERNASKGGPRSTTPASVPPKSSQGGKKPGAKPVAPRSTPAKAAGSGSRQAAPANGKGTSGSRAAGRAAETGRSPNGSTNGKGAGGAATGGGANGAVTGSTGDNGKAVDGSRSTPTRTNGSGSGNGSGNNPPRTGAGAGAGGRTGASQGNRTNRKRRGR